MTTTRIPRPNGEGFFTVEEVRRLGFSRVAPPGLGYRSGQMLYETGTVHHVDGCQGAWDEQVRRIWEAEDASDESLAAAERLCGTCLNNVGLRESGGTYVRRRSGTPHLLCVQCGFAYPAHLIVDGLCPDHRDAIDPR